MRKHRNRTRVLFVPGLLILAALAAVPGFAADVTLTASTGAGIMYGVAREFVYGAYNNQSYIKSQLDWDIRPLLHKGRACAERVGGIRRLPRRTDGSPGENRAYQRLGLAEL